MDKNTFLNSQTAILTVKMFPYFAYRSKVVCASVCAKTPDCEAFGAMFDDANARVCKLASAEGLYNNGLGDLDEIFVDATIDLRKIGIRTSTN